MAFAAARTLSADLPAKLPAPPDRAAIKKMFDAYRAPVPPRHLVDNIYYVGAIGVSSFLITTPAGHILLDTGFDDTGQRTIAGMEKAFRDQLAAERAALKAPK